MKNQRCERVKKDIFGFLDKHFYKNKKENIFGFFVFDENLKYAQRW